MRKLTIIEHISLDGVIQHSVDEEFRYEGWFVPFMSPEGGAAVLAAQGEHFDLLLARRTYDEWSSSWGQAPSSPLADLFDAATKYVVTHRRDDLAWGPAEAVGADVIASVRALLAEAGPDLVVWGSSSLTSLLLEHGLVDELTLITYPVLLGVGKRLFAPGTPALALEPVQTTSTTTGVVISTYRVHGPVAAV
ncbi:dihydrofolate reductase family protein [Leucobacter sp. USHLN153]|uniref:dihydrofolate reductase family protein n=1 Tax=Leucobacter sp. USHLN153 TaxID=3081268 RepID=UPI00301793C5